MRRRNAPDAVTQRCVARDLQRQALTDVPTVRLGQVLGAIA
jgi:hypothetical protein